MSLRVGIVGCGGVAGAHAPAWQAAEGAQTVAVCDIDENRAKAFAEKYNAKAYFKLEAMLSDAKLDLADVCTREMHHCEPVVQCLKAGLHILCEKPIHAARGQFFVQPDDLEKAHQMIDAWKASKVNFGINFQYRHLPHSRKLKELIDSGTLGDPVSINVSAHLNCWSHVIDLMRWFNGDVAELSATVAGPENQPDREAWLKFKNGTIGHIYGTTRISMAYLPLRIEYTGTKARGIISNLAGSIDVQPHRQDQGVSRMYEEFGDGRSSEFGVGFRRSMQEFANAIIEGRQPLVTGTDGLKELEIDAGMFESAYKGSSIKINA